MKSSEPLLQTATLEEIKRDILRKGQPLHASAVAIKRKRELSIPRKVFSMRQKDICVFISRRPMDLFLNICWSWIKV